MATLKAATTASKTDHNGTVSTSGSPNVFVNGINAVIETHTDHVSCPISGHDNPEIATGSNTVFVNDKAMVRETDTVSSPCGGAFDTNLSSNVLVG
jgi:uncharacterized Zn-binding protein involved in type VI secretion